MVFPLISERGSLAAIQLLVQEDFSDVCHKEYHLRRLKRIFRFKSCDTVCTRCRYDEEPTIEVIRYKERNVVRLDDITQFVDCSHIKKKYSEGDTVIQLKANHTVDKCQVNNFCSLACKIENVMHRCGTLSSIDRMNIRVRKKRTEGRRKREVTKFQRILKMTMANSKARSGGRIRRVYRPVIEGHIPPKKRKRGE